MRRARAARIACARFSRAGEDIDRPTPDGVTPLMVAIDNFEFDTAKLLLDAGANPHVADWWGRTALYVAVDMNTYVPRSRRAPAIRRTQPGIDIVRLLLAAGVEVRIRSSTCIGRAAAATAHASSTTC